MKRLGRFLDLNVNERRLIFRAAVAVAGFRLALWVFPFSVLRKFFASRQPFPYVHGSEPVGRSDFSKEKHAWAVQAAARRIPAATCLTQALALHYLLLRSGHSCTVQIGVTRDESRKFKAHAWVRSEDTILLGGREAERYTPIYAWGGGQ